MDDRGTQGDAYTQGYADAVALHLKQARRYRQALELILEETARRSTPLTRLINDIALKALDPKEKKE